MDGTKTNAGVDSSPDHVVGKWFSVPELRLRDHYFTVPLDYSLDRRTCPKISVFAREVVSGGVALITFVNYVLNGVDFLILVFRF